MITYSAPLCDYRFLLEHVLDYPSRVAILPGYEDASLELVSAVLEEGARLAEKAIAPLNRSGDEEGCHWNSADGTVRTPAGFKEVFTSWRKGGWPGLTLAEAWGGQGLPNVVGLLLREMVSAANISFGTYAGLSLGAYHAINAHATEEIKQRFLPNLAAGNWTGTMCLTESHCGSDLGLLRTRAVPAGEGEYRIIGTKIFVTAGQHDLSDNIVHLVLARLPDAPPGIRGLSLFAVPKFREDASRGWTVPNSVVCTGIEHKMGLRASATATLAFEGAHGYLIGEPHRGMRAMFTMMNTARLGVSVQAVALAEGALQAAVSYAKERRQGRGADGEGPVAIIEHPDVRRNLLNARAFVEGARALWLWTAVELDRSQRDPDPAVKSEAENLLALLTPVLKAFASERSFAATNAAMQVFGGHGYIRETGVEQFVRDGRIIPLYEGTNGIQALDLVSRKIGLDDGRTVTRFFALVTDEAAAIAGPRPEFAKALMDGLQLLRTATELVSARSQDDPNVLGAAGHDYLQLFGLVAMGMSWAKLTRASLVATAPGDRAIGDAKLEVAAFFFARVMPETAYFYRCVATGTAPLMGLRAEQF